MSTSTSTNIRHAFYILAGAVALVLTWPHAFRWIAAGGNILNPVEFFGDAIAAGGTATFLSIDMAIAWLVFMVWVVTDSKRIGLGYKLGLPLRGVVIRGCIDGVPCVSRHPRALPRQALSHTHTDRPTGLTVLDAGRLG